MDSGTDAARHDFCAGKRWPGGREGRSLLGGAFLSRLRNVGLDYAQADRRSVAGNLRLRPVLRPVLYPRQRYCASQALLSDRSATFLSYDRVVGVIAMFRQQSTRIALGLSYFDSSIFTPVGGSNAPACK